MSDKAKKEIILGLIMFILIREKGYKREMTSLSF